MNAVSLFAGCGGLDLGIVLAGFSVRLAIESDPICVQSYTANLPDCVAACIKVEDVDEAFLHQSLGEYRGSIDLLVGGPPCPPFSKSRFYRREKPRGIEDQLGFSTINGYINILRILRPRAFLLENVAGFAFDVHRAALDQITAHATELGYECEWRVLNAADFGVPQLRERFFLVGVRGGPRFVFPPPSHADFSSSDLLGSALLPWRTAGDVLNDLDALDDGDDTGHRAGGKHGELLRLVPPGDNYLFFTKERGHPQPQFKWRSRYWSFLLKLSPAKPSWTIQARRSNNMGPFHWRNRILRISEVKRLQTFPDGWQLVGTVDQQWRQIGNAVPPHLARVLGTAIRNHLTENRRDDEEPSQHERVLARGDGRVGAPASGSRSARR